MAAGNVMVGGSMGYQAPGTMSGMAQTPSPQSGSETGLGAGFSVNDGTAIRVAIIALAMALGLWGFKQAGYKFNVVSG